MAVEPIKPKQAEARRRQYIPDAVLEAFNELISQNLRSGYSKFKQKDVITAIMLRVNNPLGDSYTAQEICDRGWLDVEGIYRDAGWKVTYDKPGYSETYPATYTFQEK